MGHETESRPEKLIEPKNWLKNRLRRPRRRKKALLFVNKKKQKNFVTLGPCRFSASGPESQKFLRRFFQKAAAFFKL
jgi:hypothetical protein